MLSPAYFSEIIISLHICKGDTIGAGGKRKHWQPSVSDRFSYKIDISPCPSVFPSALPFRHPTPIVDFVDVFLAVVLCGL